MEPKIGNETGAEQKPDESASEKKGQPKEQAEEQKQKAKTGKKEGAKPEEGKQTAEQPEKPDPYLAFIRASQIVSPNDVAIYKQGDGHLIVFTDPLGRSALSCSLYLKREIMESLKKSMA